MAILSVSFSSVYITQVKKQIIIKDNKNIIMIFFL